MISVGGYDYIKGTALAAKLPPGSSWLRVRRSTLATAVGVPTSSSAMVAELQAASRVRRLGTATVNGASTTEYRFVIDLRKLAAGAASGSLMRRAIGIGETQMPVTAWIERSGLITRQQSSFSISGAAVTLIVNASYGGVVVVNPPPASQVAVPPTLPAS